MDKKEKKPLKYTFILPGDTDDEIECNLNKIAEKLVEHCIQQKYTNIDKNKLKRNNGDKVSYQIFI